MVKKKAYIYGAERSCPVCSTLFRPRDKGSQQQCCSNACRGRLQTIKATKKCVQCGNEFLPTRAAYATCSRACGTAYRLSRRIIDPMVESRKRLAVFCCTVIARCLRNKTGRTSEMLGYTVEELRAHLEAHFEPGMSWSNYGKKTDQWSIDHSRPISTFDLTAKVSEINALSNLRPMWHTKNCAKKNKWEGQ